MKSYVVRQEKGPQTAKIFCPGGAAHPAEFDRPPNSAESAQIPIFCGFIPGFRSLLLSAMDCENCAGQAIVLASAKAIIPQTVGSVLSAISAEVSMKLQRGLQDTWREVMRRSGFPARRVFCRRSDLAKDV